MIKEYIDSIRRKHKLAEMDRLWREMNGNCLGGYPPSFFLTHTKEEAEEIMKRDHEERQELKKQLK